MTTRVLSTPPKIALGIHFHGYGTKTTQYFYLLIEKHLGCYFHVWSLLTLRQHSATRKHLFLHPQGYRTGQEAKKRIDIKICHSYHQYSSPQFSLTVRWLRFSFNQPNMKRWGSKLINVINIYTKVFLLWHHP